MADYFEIGSTFTTIASVVSSTSRRDLRALPPASGYGGGSAAAAAAAAAAAVTLSSSPRAPSAAMDAAAASAATTTTVITTEHIQQQLLNSTEDERQALYMALNTKYEITDVLPPPNHDDQQVLVMAFGYMLLFMMGTCGNAVVLSKIYDVVKSRRSNFVDNTVIYIVVLCFVDFGVCLSLPMTVIDQILGFWMFGTIVCKIHAVLENFGKVFSALVLTAMAFDRYAGVCHPQRKVLRKTSVAIAILLGMIIYAILTLSPLLSNFTARELVLFEKETAPNKITRMRIEKCTMVNVSSTNFTIFTGILFIFCFVVPLVLVGYFYSQLWWKLRQHARQFKGSQIPLMRVSLLTLAMAFFYFMCWAPFWFATVYAVYLEYQGDQGGTVPPIFVYFMYFIHALPFTNSAVNWILYGMLNRQLQRKRTDWCCVNSTNCHTEPNTTLMANGHTATQMTTLNTALRNVPSLNGLSRVKPTNSSYDSHVFGLQGSNPPSSNQRSSCCIQLSLNGSSSTQHQNPPYQHHIPASSRPNTVQHSPHLSPRASVPTVEFQGYASKRASQSDVETQTEEANYRSGVNYGIPDFSYNMNYESSSVAASDVVYGSNMVGWRINNDDSKKKHSAGTSYKEGGEFGNGSSLVDSSYSSSASNSNANNNFADAKGGCELPPYGGKDCGGSNNQTHKRRDSSHETARFELESLLPTSHQQHTDEMMMMMMMMNGGDNSANANFVENEKIACATAGESSYGANPLYRKTSNSNSSSITNSNTAFSDNGDEDVDLLLKSDSEATFL